MRKSGYTLVELMVSMTMISAVLAISLGLLHRVMREQKFAEAENGLHRVAERLSIRLREDVRASLRAEWSGGEATVPSELTLVQPDSVVTYTLKDRSLERQATGESALTHRDFFDFPTRYRLAWDAGPPSGQVGLTLLVDQIDESTDDRTPGSRRGAMRVAVSVGRGLRFSTTGDTP